MISITKRRLASLATASAMVATLAVASMPAATMAAAPTSGPTGFFRDGKELTAKQIGGVVTGDIDAQGYDIAVYNPTSVTNADIHGAQYYGVVVNGLSNINLTGSKVHHIGDNPYGANGQPAFSGMQRGNAILYINGASGTISGNQVYKFQKNGITVTGKDANNAEVSKPTTSASVSNNKVTGEGDIAYIAQNGIQISFGATATVVKNTVSGFNDTDPDWEASGLLLWQVGRVNVQNNNISKVTNEVDIYTYGATTGHVKP